MPSSSKNTAETRQSIEAELHLIEKWLPHQGPLGVFIHQNTLAAFEDQTFWDAVESSAQTRSSQPYMPHTWYLAALRAGRIENRHCDFLVAEYLERHPKVPKLEFHSSESYRAALLVPRLITSDEAVLSSLESELRTAEARMLWNGVQQATQSLRDPADQIGVSLPLGREGLSPVDRILIPLVSAFLDQGFAFWPMPFRSQGFFAAIQSQLTQSSRSVAGPWRWFSSEARELLLSHKDPIDLIATITARYEFEESPVGASAAVTSRQNLLQNEALALAGWAGMFASLGHKTDSGGIRTNLAEYLAIRLLLKISVSANEPRGLATEQEALFKGHTLWIAREAYLVLREMKIPAQTVLNWKRDQWISLDAILRTFGDIPRRRLLHQAYEKQYAEQLAGAIEVHNRVGKKAKRAEIQAVFCIDEREESFRRHLEELAPECETFGAAGFFGMDMCFQELGHETGPENGLDNGSNPPVPLCPPVIKPKHLVVNRQPKNSGYLAPHFLNKLLHEGSRRFFGGALLAQSTGLLSLAPLFSKVIFPSNNGGNHSSHDHTSELEFEHFGEMSAEGLQRGYTIFEMADRVEGILKGAGLVNNFAPLIVLTGHGSRSLNNPHESAHDCGACGGRRGAPNARVFARMANHPAVRAEIFQRGIAIPDSTWFVGAYHDTCSDEVRFSDVHLIPPQLKSPFDSLCHLFDRARALNAAERCRRFSRGNDGDPSLSLKHVSERCQDYREPRPEYGHATNAALIVGRRSLTRGLFLDRRAFLVSYDPSIDSDGKILGRLLSAVIPVCAGISLEYYFSFVDNELYGCGTKLPHNVVGLMGVMNGSVSDLRTGLPLQMVEIHEPMRLVVILESSPEIVDRLISEQPNLARLVDNEWLQLKIYDRKGQANAPVIYQRVDRTWQICDFDGTPLGEERSSFHYTQNRSLPLSPSAIVGAN